MTLSAKKRGVVIGGDAENNFILTGDGNRISLTRSGELAFHLLDEAFRTRQQEKSKPTVFYDGSRPNWANIVLAHDARRNLYDHFRSFVENENDRLPLHRMGLILGLAGEGKTTLLMRLAWDLAKSGWPVLWHHSGSILQTTAPDFQRSYDRPLVLCFDQADDVALLPTLAAELSGYGIPFVILATSRFHEWRHAEMETALRRLVRLQKELLGRLDEGEVNSLLDVMDSHDALGNLAQHSRTEQIQHFTGRLQADGQLLPALLTARQGYASFADIVTDVLHRLRQRPDGDLVYRAYLYVSAIHRFGLGMPRSVLTQMLNIEPHMIRTHILGPLEGELAEIDGTDQLYTRHPLVAESVVKQSATEYWCDLRFVYQQIFRALADTMRHTPFKNSLRGLLTSLARKLEHSEPQLIRVLIKERSTTHAETTGDNLTDALLDETWAVIGRSIGEYDASRQLFARATKLDPQRVSIWQAWGVLETRAGDMQSARRLFQQGESVDLTHAPLWQAWALMEEKAGNVKRARTLFEEGVAADPTHAPLWQAWALMEQKADDVVRARELFEKGVTADPTHVQSWQAWALMEQKSGDVKRARTLFEKGVAADPTDAPLWQAWALMEQKTGDAERARTLFEEGVAADPTDAHLWQAWALMEQKAGDVALARELFEKGVAADPTHAPLWQAWALMEQKTGDVVRARELFEEGVAADPTNAPLWQAWALMEQKAGDVDRARTLFEEGVAADPTNAPLWQAWALMEQRQKNFKRAVEFFEKLAYIAPKRNEGWHGWALLNMSQFRNLSRANLIIEEGLQHVEGLQDQAILYCDLGRILSRLRAYDEAQKAFEKSLQCDESNAHTHFFFAEMLERIGERKDAYTHYRRAHELAENSKQKNNIQRKLAEFSTA